MAIHFKIDQEHQMLLDLNSTIHENSKQFEYHMKHIQLVSRYSMILNKKLNMKINPYKLTYIAYAHDLFKERGLDPNRILVINDKDIPQDNVRYVRTNLDVLEEFGLDDYFNTDIQYHALAAGIFVYKEFGIRDKEILYPIFFHSCPIISVYKNLNQKIRNMIDIIMLADKLSSNYLRINFRHVDVRIDLDLAVFGTSGIEINYTLGLYLARLISQGKSEETQSKIATEYYYNRLQQMNPFISNECSIKMLGGNKQWPERNSQVLMTP